jgi:predicted ester cyclase
MASITAIANDFFAACQAGKGWEVCKAYCALNATFAAQAEPLAGIKTVAEYADRMKGVMTTMPDGSHEVKSFATNAERNNVAAYAVFSGTHTGPGGPCEPTGKMALKELGWA